MDPGTEETLAADLDVDCALAVCEEVPLLGVTGVVVVKAAACEMRGGKGRTKCFVRKMNVL